MIIPIDDGSMTVEQIIETTKCFTCEHKLELEEHPRFRSLIFNNYYILVKCGAIEDEDTHFR